HTGREVAEIRAVDVRLWHTLGWMLTVHHMLLSERRAAAAARERRGAGAATWRRCEDGRRTRLASPHPSAGDGLALHRARTGRDGWFRGQVCFTLSELLLYPLPARSFALRCLAFG